MPRRERHYSCADAYKVLRLAGKNELTRLVIAVVKRANADRVTGSDEFPRFAVIDDAGKLGIKHGEHTSAVLLVHWQEYLAVGIAFKAVALFNELAAAFQSRKARRCTHTSFYRALNGCIPESVSPIIESL